MKPSTAFGRKLLRSFSKHEKLLFFGDMAVHEVIEGTVIHVYTWSGFWITQKGAVVAGIFYTKQSKGNFLPLFHYIKITEK